MRGWPLTILVALAVAGTARPASADVTVFVGANTTPVNRTIRGTAIGAGLLFAAFEFEYASTSSDVTLDAPAVTSGMGQALLQTPLMIHGFQPYVTAGLGVYRERRGAHTETGFASSTGAGVKVSLAGPLRLRVDYRIFKLRSGALSSPAHRVYAGLNLTF